MTYRTGVLGASGYTGAELLRLLANHPEFDVVLATAGTNAGQAVAELYPALGPAYPRLNFETLAPDSIDNLDLVFLALPHGESQKLVPDLVGRVKHITDLAADFRLPAPIYSEWYGEAHSAPELLKILLTACRNYFAADSTRKYLLPLPVVIRLRVPWH